MAVINNTRRIEALNIKAINTQNTVESNSGGSCQEMTNMRYNGSGWEEVGAFAVDEVVNNTDGFKIIYKHDIGEVSRYIATKEGWLAIVEIKEGKACWMQNICQVPNGEKPNISHFGNIIFVRWLSYEPMVEQAFVWHQYEYVELDFSKLKPLNNVEITYTHKSASAAETLLSAIATIELSEENSRVEKKRDIGAFEHYNVLNNEGFITGAVYLIFAYKLFDGSVIRNSRAYMLESEGVHSKSKGTLRGWSDGFIRKYEMAIAGCKPRLKIVLPAGVSANPLIKSVVVYATREAPIYDFEKLTVSAFNSKAYPEQGMLGRSVAPRSLIINDNILDGINAPFYQLKEIAITDFLAGAKSLDLVHSDFDTIESNNLYNANFSVHDLCSKGAMEYNNRLHRYNVYSKFADCAMPLENREKVQLDGVVYVKKVMSGCQMVSVVELECGREQRRVVSVPIVAHYYVEQEMENNNSALRYVIHQNMVNYPDYRAKSVEYMFVKNGLCSTIVKYSLTEAPANNYSYHRKDNLDGVFRLVAVLVPSNMLFNTVLPKDDRVIKQSAKMMVSQMDNPFSFDPIHTYAVGANGKTVILKVEAAADQITETRFGDHPLLLFTTDGIYALEQGSGEVLYSRALMISKDEIAGSCATLSVKGLVFFVSQRGLMVVRGRTTDIISEPLHGSTVDNGKNGVSVQEYIVGSGLYYINCYDEVMVYNSAYSFGFIYSLKYGCWTKRSFSGRSCGSSGCLVLDMAGGGALFVSLSSAENQSERMLPLFTTNPFRLSSDEYKRVDVFTVGLAASFSALYRVMLLGSNDLISWSVVGVLQNMARMRRSGSSWRYFKVHLEVGALGAEGHANRGHFAVSSLEFEYHFKFMRHLRSSVEPTEEGLI